MAKQPRKYSPIWDKIKKEKQCIVDVHPAMVARVKKAVIKEKHRDLNFKVLNDHDYFFLDVSREAKGKLVRLTFKLRQRFGLEGVKG